MNLLSSAAAAFSAAMLVWLSALPDPGTSSPRTAYAAREDSILARVEREVTGPLRERAGERWRFSRVHRPTPVHRTVPDVERSDRRYAAFRILVTERFGTKESALWLVRVDRASGAIELAPATGAAAAPRWQPVAAVLTPHVPVRTDD